MTHYNRILTGVTLTVAMLGFIPTRAMAQPKPYYGALLYSISRDTSVPPIYAGQPQQVTTAYLWLDEAMRLYPENVIENYINSFSWNDTAKTVVSSIYQMLDDNPLSFYIWSGKAIKPNPYKSDPGRARVVLENKVMRVAGSRTYSLLATDVIADIMVADTFCFIDPSAHTAKDAVLVNCTILDPIKGKRVPACPNLGMRAKLGGEHATSMMTACPTYADTAAPGICLQFEYSPEWQRSLTDEYRPSTRLIDPTGGWWVKPGHEYIVFLTFIGIGADSTNEYFSVYPGTTVYGTSGGIYPVVDGNVQDPNDDFGLGGTNLTVADWKSRLRARINAIINP